MLDKLKIKGIIGIEIFENDVLKDTYKFENLVTNNGFIYLKRMLAGEISGGINRIVLGSGMKPPSINDTKLDSKLILLDVRKDLSMDKEIKFLVTVPENTFTETVFYQEAGLVYKTLTEEILLTRVVFEIPIYQKSNQSMSISYTLTLA